MKRKAIIPLVLGLAIGLLAVKFGIDAIRRAQASNPVQKTITVVQAKVDINAYDEIRMDMVDVMETVENSLVPPNERIGEVQKAVGRVTGKAIPRGSPVLASMLAPEGTPPGLTGRIPAGFRACSVKIDEVTGVAYQLKPGDWVDVSVVMDVESGRRGKKEMLSEVILQRIQVAAIGYESTPDNEKSLTKVKPAKSATLLVQEQDVPKLHLASTRGRITLAMRGDEDTTVSKTPAKAYGSDLGSQDAVAALPPRPNPMAQLSTMLAQHEAAEPEPHSVMVFHGSGRGAQATAMEQITFAGPNSSKIVEMSIGGPSRAAATLRGGARAPQPSGLSAPANPNSNAVPVMPDSVIDDDEDFND